ncbi:hypothetical protein DLAC_11459 [Tieghemostelium lacteum]|uniref:Uncharacterized protein n=1 Tax=Tieghemostelium lacteum TaxID=361077 RepID=A0A152A7P2_TIELA|nr:hypothetical protein DLAC_11459 [Tieghemostelium lacteum]|eukprot:KYR02214.1 hypothetical protein DLAC_11459 [Tieghemostelium lacteum]
MKVPKVSFLTDYKNSKRINHCKKPTGLIKRRKILGIPFTKINPTKTVIININLEPKRINSIEILFCYMIVYTLLSGRRYQ